MRISRLESVPLRELWANEAHDFTTWLAENLDLLGEALGTELSFEEQEASAGPFSADIVASDSAGDAVIIENQLERTDHDHLGKLITYVSNLDAKTAVWITSEPRPEHEQAVHWLNEVMPADMAFYLVKIEAYRIEESAPAPRLTVVAGPSVEARQVGKQKKELAERHLLQRDFWSQLLEKAKKRTALHAQISARPGTRLGAGSGRSGLVFNYRIRMGDSEVALAINTPDAQENKRIFDALHAKREKIEGAFGTPLSWHRLEDTRVSVIAFVMPDGGLREPERWPEVQDRMIDAMVRLERALKPEIQRLK